MYGRNFGLRWRHRVGAEAIKERRELMEADGAASRPVVLLLRLVFLVAAAAVVEHARHRRPPRRGCILQSPGRSASKIGSSTSLLEARVEVGQVVVLPDGMARDHNAGEQSEPYAARMGELLPSRNRQQGVSGARCLRGDAVAPVGETRAAFGPIGRRLSMRGGWIIRRPSIPRPRPVQPAKRLAAAAPKNTMPESAVIQKLVGQSV